MGAVVIIDIIHMHNEDPEAPDNMAIMARGLLDPESSCEHEIAIATLFVKKVGEIQGEVIQEAAKAFVDQGFSMSDEKEDTGETVH